MTLNQISIAIDNLRDVIQDLKLETISIAKTETINNVPWNNIKSRLLSIFINILN